MNLGPEKGKKGNKTFVLKFCWIIISEIAFFSFLVKSQQLLWLTLFFPLRWNKRSIFGFFLVFWGLGHLIRIGIMDEGIERIIFFLGSSSQRTRISKYGYCDQASLVFSESYNLHISGIIIYLSPQKCGLLEMIYTIFVYITWRSGWLWKARSKINGRL